MSLITTNKRPSSVDSIEELGKEDRQAEKRVRIDVSPLLFIEEETSKAASPINVTGVSERDSTFSKSMDLNLPFAVVVESKERGSPTSSAHSISPVTNESPLLELQDPGLDEEDFAHIHSDIKRLAKAFGYPERGGLCHGIAYMGGQAALSGKINSFDNRIKKMAWFLKKNEKNFEKAVEEIKKDPAFYTDCLAFFDGVFIAHDTQSRDCKLFDVPMNIKEARACIASEQLEKRKGREVCHQSHTMMSAEEIARYLDLIVLTMKRQGVPFPIVIDCSTGIYKGDFRHTVCLSYHSKTNTWSFIDSNFLPTMQKLDSSEAAKELLEGFDYTFSQDFTKEGSLLFKYKISTTGIHVEALKEILEKVQETKEFSDIHEITEEKATRESAASSLRQAIFMQNKAFIKALIKKGVDIEKSGDPLYHAITFPGEEITRLLLDLGANFEALDSFGNTPLITAVARGETAIVRLLLERGAHPDGESKEGHTAMAAAIQIKDRDMILMLYQEYRASLHLHHLSIALNLGAEGSDTIELIKELLSDNYPEDQIEEVVAS